MAWSGLLELRVWGVRESSTTFLPASTLSTIIWRTVLTQPRELLLTFPSLGRTTRIQGVSYASGMAHANVSNSVLTIIASFSNGLDVLKKLRRSDKKGTRPSKTAKRNDENALCLSRSLRHGPEEIGREYQAGSVRCDSEQYAMGDGKPSILPLKKHSRLMWHSYRSNLPG